ncbi:endonuclease domain-containing protein [Lysobacter cavernae]
MAYDLPTGLAELKCRAKDDQAAVADRFTDACQVAAQGNDGGRTQALAMPAGWPAGEFKFRRQHPVPPYIVDFCCADARLIVELDGSQHSHEVNAARTKYLESQGWRVIRFWDNDALTATEAVIEAIFDALGHRTLTPTPLPMGEGL